MRRKINIADAEALLKFYKNNDTDWTFANFTGNVNEYFGIKKKKVKFFFENNNFKPI